jgi:hypothetical protein
MAFTRICHFVCAFAGSAVHCQWCCMHGSVALNQKLRSLKSTAANGNHSSDIIPDYDCAICCVRYLQMLPRYPRAAAAVAGGSHRPYRTPAAKLPAVQAPHHLPGSSSCSLVSWSCHGQQLVAAAGPCPLRRHLLGCSHLAGGLAMRSAHFAEMSEHDAQFSQARLNRTRSAIDSSSFKLCVTLDPWCTAVLPSLVLGRALAPAQLAAWAPNLTGPHQDHLQQQQQQHAAPSQSLRRQAASAGAHA